MAKTELTAQYLNADGSTCRGRVRFKLAAVTYHDGLDAIFPPVPVSVELTTAGTISVDLEPTSGDDCEFDSDTLTYEVQERINGTERDPYYIDVPTSAVAVDLGTLVLYDAPAGVIRQMVDVNLSGLVTADELTDTVTTSVAAATAGMDYAPAVLPVETAAATATLVHTMNGIGYGAGIADSSKLYSTTNGTTWSLVNDLPAGAIVGIGEVTGGEVVVITSGTVYRSTGWAAQPSTATWTAVATRTSNGGANPQASFISSTWDVNGDYVLVTDYVAPDRTNSRYLQLSTDAGLTFSNVYDLNTEYVGSEDDVHYHGVCIDTFHDPVTPRLWFVHGDGPRGVFYSDDLGVSWDLITGSDSVTSPSMQMMTVTATQYGVVLTTDSNSPDGVWRILRTDTPSDQVLELIYRLPYKYAAGALLGFGIRSWRDDATGWVYMTWVWGPGANLTTSGHAFVFASDGYRAGLVWQSEITAAANESVRSDGVGILANGTLIVNYTDNSSNPYAVVMPAPTRGLPSYADMNGGNALDGTAVGRDGVAIGVDAVARVRSVQIGANTIQAASTEMSTAVGAEVVAGEQSVHVGFQAGGGTAYNYTTAVGSGTVVAAAECTVVGEGATAGNVRTNAIGRDAVASGLDQVVNGYGATAHASATAAVVIGSSADASGAQTAGVAIGGTAQTSGQGAVAVGYGAVASGSNAMAYGQSADATTTGAIAVGSDAQATHQDAIALGRSVATTSRDQVAIGGKHIALTEISGASLPAAPAANGGALYLEDNGSGKTVLKIRFATGAVQTIATEP
jgi:hypothetical protein